MQNNSNNKIDLSDDQQKVYNDLINFLKGPKKEIILIGYAGTGKTTLVAKLINDIIKTKLCKKIVVAAPTHKAVNIAKSKLFSDINSGDELSKNINIMTIHRLLNYQSMIDENGKKYFGKSNNDPNWSIYDLLVVDECSMLTNQIISDIESQLANELNAKIKIIYVGDPAQLPPVNQSDSRIFKRKIPSSSLDQIIRTKNQEIMNLSNDHRTWIFSQKNSDIPHVENYISNNIQVYSAQNNELNKWLDKFVIASKSQSTKTYDNSNIILTWTNAKCDKYNQYVRENLFNKKKLNLYEIGEILIFDDFHRIEIKVEENLDDNVDPIEKKKDYFSFYTSDQIKLISIEEIKFTFEPIKFKINKDVPQNINDEFKKKINILNKKLDITIDVLSMEIKKIAEIKMDEASAPLYSILSLCPKSRPILKKLSDDFDLIINEIKINSYKLISDIKKITNMKKCDYQAEIEKKINKLYKDWQSHVLDRFAELNYGYCITVHKSQGSTFDNVYIDISDILDNRNLSETSKCIYTAITRAAETLNLHI